MTRWLPSDDGGLGSVRTDGSRTARPLRTGRELWKSDGTEAGTSQVADVRPGSNGSNPSELVNVDGTLFFTANDGTHGAELWLSNGFVAGTMLVEDIGAGPFASSPSEIGAIDDRPYLAATTEMQGREIWSGILEPAGPNGDFNGDGLWDCVDIDSLIAEIASGTNHPTFDLNGDQAVNLLDRDAWLIVAGEINLGPARVYRLGDANLNGSVDGSDFSIWNANQFTQVAAWCSGDFNTNGVVDGSDFNIWNSNKFTSSDHLMRSSKPISQAQSDRATLVGLPMPVIRSLPVPGITAAQPKVSIPRTLRFDGLRCMRPGPFDLWSTSWKVS